MAWARTLNYALEVQANGERRPRIYIQAKLSDLSENQTTKRRRRRVRTFSTTTYTPVHGDVRQLEGHVIHGRASYGGNQRPSVECALHGTAGNEHYVFVLDRNIVGPS